jgi:hypothetical protein
MLLCLSLYTYDLFIHVIISLGQGCPAFFEKHHSRCFWVVRGGTRVKITASCVHKGIIYLVKCVSYINIYRKLKNLTQDHIT